MADLTAEEISEGKKQLSGPRIIFWIGLVVMILGVIGAIFNIFAGNFDFIANWISASNILLISILELFWFLLWVILFWVEIAATSGQKPYAVGLGRFLIIWMMIFTFPIGTIIGAIIWKRFSDPAAQKYLNYIK